MHETVYSFSWFWFSIKTNHALHSSFMIPVLLLNSGLTQPLSQKSVHFYKLTGTWVF